MQFPSIEQFWSHNPAREGSEEADFGFHWRRPGDPYRWKLSYIRNTGEVYCVRLDTTEGPVEVLGVIPPDTGDPDKRTGSNLSPAPFCRTATQVLQGWPVRCHDANGLEWVRRNLRNAGYPPQ